MSETRTQQGGHTVVVSTTERSIPGHELRTTSVVGSVVGMADHNTNTYNLAVAVTYSNPPTGNITINVGGTDYTFTPNGSGSDTFTINDLSANGTAGIDVSATFVGDAACTYAL